MRSKLALKDSKLLAFLAHEYDQPFQGWDFSYISRTGRMVESPLSWSYGSIIIQHARDAGSLLDIGTGDGELLASLLPLATLTCATESYHPNVALAKETLEPLGVKVYETRAEGPLPFQDGAFDVVIDRHESYSSAEVFRILKPSGCFITQQVGSKNDNEIRRLLGAGRFPTNKFDLQSAARQLSEAGFVLDFLKEEYPSRRFYDVGALVYYLKAVPWVIPDFTVQKYLGSLTRLNGKTEREGYLEDKNHRFIIVAQKPEFARSS